MREVEITDDDLRAPAVTDCMRAAPLDARFPSWAGPAEVTYPLELRAAEVTPESG